MDLRALEQVGAVIAVGCYAVAALVVAVAAQTTGQRIARTLTGIGLGANTVTLLMRGLAAGRLPFASQYEFALVFAWAIVAILYPLSGQRPRIVPAVAHAGVGLRELKLFVLPVAAGLLLWAVLTPQEIRPLMPALRSGWLTFHVSLAAGSYASFAVAGGAGALYLFRQRGAPEVLVALDYLQYRLIAWGYVGLTLAILTGAVWAYNAWGRYWGWDPKETWSLVTWIVYSIYLHLRLRRGWSRRGCAIMSVVAFGCVLFTFVGVNLLLPGLHTYR